MGGVAVIAVYVISTQAGHVSTSTVGPDTVAAGGGDDGRRPWA
jgi:hypothetical protein